MSLFIRLIFNDNILLITGLRYDDVGGHGPFWLYTTSWRFERFQCHRLENVMTVVPGFYLPLDQLKVWFVATNVENRYKLEAAEPFILNNYPEYVTFKAPDSVKFPVPSVAYLAIHAACAKVAHLSGAGAYIDKFYRDMDDSTTLDPSGASAEMLKHAIFELQAAGRPISN